MYLPPVWVFRADDVQHVRPHERQPCVPTRNQGVQGGVVGEQGSQALAGVAELGTGLARDQLEGDGALGKLLRRKVKKVWKLSSTNHLDF